MRLCPAQHLQIEPHEFVHIALHLERIGSTKLGHLGQRAVANDTILWPDQRATNPVRHTEHALDTLVQQLIQRGISPRLAFGLPHNQARWSVNLDNSQNSNSVKISEYNNKTICVLGILFKKKTL